MHEKPVQSGSRTGNTELPNSRVSSFLPEQRIVVLFIALVASLVIGVIVFWHWWKGVPYSDLTRDPNAIAGIPFYFGFLSQLGIFVWAGSAAVCAFGAAILAVRESHVPILRFLIASALISLILGADDAFQLHETFFPSIGIEQYFVLSFYVIMMITYLAKFFSLILKANCLLLVAALSLFAVSVAFDLFVADISSMVIFEDGAKFIGLLAWFAYFFQATYKAVLTCIYSD